MKVRVFTQTLCVATLALMALGATAAELVVIDLHNRTADELLPVIRPMAGDAALSGADYKLFVRGTASDVARIREMLNVIDRAPQQLMISVRYSGTPQSRDSDVRGAASITDRNSEVVLNGHVVRSTASDNSISSVRVLEGNGAHISTGQSVPVIGTILSTASNGKHPARLSIATDYRELTSGFDVVPRVNGDRVVLEISTQQQRAGASVSGTVTTQRTTSTLAGRLGEWIELGGVDSSFTEQRNSAGVAGGSRHTTTQSDQRIVAVKVEKSE